MQILRCLAIATVEDRRSCGDPCGTRRFLILHDLSKGLDRSRGVAASQLLNLAYDLGATTRIAGLTLLELSHQVSLSGSPSDTPLDSNSCTSLARVTVCLRVHCSFRRLDARGGTTQVAGRITGQR